MLSSMRRRAYPSRAVGYPTFVPAAPTKNFRWPPQEPLATLSAGETRFVGEFVSEPSQFFRFCVTVPLSADESLYRMCTECFLGSLCLAPLLLGPSANAQATAPPPMQSSASAGASTSYAKEPYVFELIESDVRFEADGTGQRDLTIRVRIQSESAVRQFGLLVYPFASSFESLDVVYVRVRRPDGTVLETPPSDVQELDSAVSREAPMYTDEREKHIAVKSLAVGDVLEGQLRWTVHEPMARGHFWYDDSYFKAGICLKEIIQFDVPANVSVKLRHVGPDPAVREEGGRRVYVFTSSNLKTAEESKIPDWEKNAQGAALPDIELSSFSSWADVGAWYSALQQPKTVVTPEIRAKAEELTNGKSSDDERLRAIYSFVSTRFRYIGVDLGLGRYTPHAAADVLVNRYGDCKDKHTLFAALLQAVGIAAYPALISSKFKIDPSFPSPSAFDHVITAIPRGDGFLFLDTTPEVAPFGLLMQTIRDRQALVMPTSAPAYLVTTPADPPIPDYERARVDASLDAQGTLDAKMHIEDRGDGELVLRIAYRAVPQNRWQDLTQNIVASMGFAGTVSDVSVTPPEDFSRPFSMDFSYHRTDYPDWKDHRVTLPSPPVALPALNEEQKASKDPLPLGPLQDVVYETTIKFPKDFVPIKPDNVDQKSDFAEFSAQYDVEKNSVHSTVHLKTLLHEVPGAERHKFDSLSKTIDETVRRYVFVRGGDFQGGAEALQPFAGFLPRPEQPIPKLEDALQHPENSLMCLYLGRAYRQAGRAKDAVTILEKAIDANPAGPEELQLELGRAYLALPDNDKALATFKTYLGKDPTSRELNDVAYALADANVFLPDAFSYASDAVAAIAADTLDISPEDAGQPDFALVAELAADWDTLGWIQFRQGDFAIAQKFLEAAWELDQSALVGEHLVEVCEKLHKPSEAAIVAVMAQSLLQSTLGPPDRALSDHLNEEARRLSPFLKPSPAPSFFGTHSTQGQVALVDMRSMDITLPVRPRAESSKATFIISFTNGDKLAKVVFVSGSEELRKATTALARTKYFQSFPDNTPAQIIRRATLNCSVYSRQCTLLIATLADAAAPIPNWVPFPARVVTRPATKANSDRH